VFAAIRIKSSDHAATLFGPTFRHTGTEELRVAHLNAQRGLIALRFHGGGNEDGCDFPIRTILEEALVLRTHGLLVAHNHPSGDPSPSSHDIAATQALAQAATSLGIRVYDHLIFVQYQWRSLHALGLL
jgi:DNA repair protein RadC